MSNQGIVTDEEKLRVKSEPVKPEEVEGIVEKLKKELDRHKNGIGLSAIQIGIPKRIFILKGSDEYHVFVNPVVADQYDPVRYPGEGCLSFPGVNKCTERYKYIHIKDDIRPPGRTLGGEDHRSQTLAVAAQHEMDHLDGILFFDRAVAPVKVEKKVGRNEPCPECMKLGKKIKYKKCKEHFHG